MSTPAPSQRPFTMDFTGKVALVTGASGGIGAAICARLTAAKATCIEADLAERPLPEGVSTIACDLGDPDAVRRMFEVLARDPGRLDLLVHCAGITRDGFLWKLQDDDWSAVLRANLDSAFHVLRGAVPMLRQAGGGAVVLVSSINGERGKVGQANYSASKGGLNALARTAARELGRFHIRVNAVAPGWIDTPMTAGLAPELRQRALEETALGQLGEPDDIAAAVLFLCSDLGRHVTGQVLRVDGGQLIG